MASITTFNSGCQNYDRLLEADTVNMQTRGSGVGSPNGGDGLGPVPDITAPQKMISAMSGSLLTSLLVTPLDVVRVRLQSQRTPTSAVDFSKLALRTTTLTPAQTAELGVTACCREVFFQGNSAELCIAVPRGEGIVESATSSVASGADCAVHEVQKKTYNSTFDGLRKIARNEGFTTLWRGLSPTLLMTIPANIIYFTGYDWLRYNPVSPLSRLSSDNAPLVAGSTARILAATAVGPIELFRTRMQAAHGTSTTNHLVETFQGVRDMVATHGYVSLWRGLTLTLWRDVPFSALYWWGYETIRSRLTDMREDSQGRPFNRAESLQSARRRSQSQENHMETFVDSFTAGALSGTFASIVTTPFDVGKTRTQVFRDGPSGLAGKAHAPEEKNMMRLLWHIFKTEGAPGLWKGWIPRVLKVAPACAIMISSYEVGKRVFRGVNERSMSEREEDN
ncbi:Mitochondrial carrier domain protein [Metarhizium guizhouense ARSEF 977]|uniref:Mitochondrial carrier domain protein n=1 Tax=Metarhizium guizhouense (strain ARSEF 977) TaxID=1276136 RepID=A0A0B4GYE9_METGA|nr:Mitochondrial carrier domain protein [Metarhizium guizhouense ARSEF 977]